MPDPREPIRLVALDIDGTLLGHDQVLRPRTVAAVRDVVNAGVVVALITGRMAAYARGVAQALGITAPLVAHHGADIRDGSSGRVLRHLELDSAVARAALRWFATRGLPTHLNRQDELIMRIGDSRASDYGRLLGVEPVLVTDLTAALEPPVTKVMAGGAPGRPAALLAEARDAFAGRAIVTIGNPRFLELLGPQASKGIAVRWLAARFHLDLSQTLAIGDNVSDLEMLAEVGHAVAMPTAPSQVRSVARHIAPPLEDDGVAQVLERFVLGARAVR